SWSQDTSPNSLPLGRNLSKPRLGTFKASAAEGITPSSGIFNAVCPGWFTLTDLSPTKHSAIPPKAPITNPIAILSGGFGLYGTDGGAAGSIIRTLVVRNEDAAPASSTF